MITNVSRRTVLKGMAGAGGFVLAARLAPAGFGPRAAAAAGRFEPNVFVAIDGEGTVTIIAHRSEMGQGVRTGLPMIVADELEADWDRVRIEQALGDAKYGRQDTDGSRSTRHHLQEMREMGATARQMLEQAAAQAWGVPAEECYARDHRVHHTPSGRSADYGELAAAAAGLPAPSRDQLRLKDRSDWKYIGKDMPIVDLVDMTTGRAVYGGDVSRPGMLVAVIERAPVYRAEAVSFDADKARAVPGVEAVVQLPAPDLPITFKPLGGVAVLAGNTWAALKGRERLGIRWSRSPHEVHDSESYDAALIACAEKGGQLVRSRGDTDGALARAAKTVEATYFVPYFIHTPMEPPAAIAEAQGDRIEVWASTQDPIATARTIGEYLWGDPDRGEANTTVHVTLLGGGFGRKSKPDFAAEAAYLARETGRPVRVVWTREDEIRHGYYHAVSAQHLKAGLDAGGRVTAWHHCVAFPSLFGLYEPDRTRGHAVEYGLGFVDLPYDVPNIRLENGEAEVHIRVGWYRSVNNIQHAYAINCFANELAAAAGRDPLEFLRELIGPARIVDLTPEVTEEHWNYGDSIADYPIDTGRLAHVLEVAADKAGYGKPLPKGHGIGLAVHRSFQSYVATAVHVAVGDDGSIQIPQVDTCIDCGTYVNPDRVRAQLEGAAVYGNTVARHGRITVAEGAVEQSNFHDYSVSRMDDAPRNVRAHIVDNERIPSGVGEPGVPPYAPALVNAIYQATGKRIRRLPIGDQLTRT